MAPSPHSTAGVAIDPERVRRALSLKVALVSKGQYRVEGSEVDYYVQTHPRMVCYCRDATYRTTACKHVLAGLIHAGDEDVLAVATRVASDPGVVRARQRSVEDEFDLPAGTPLDELIGLLEVNPGDAQLAGRIVTDPSSGPTEWAEVARLTRDEAAHIALARIPEAASNQRVRTALLDRRPHLSVVGRLLPYAEGDEFRTLFRTVLQHDRASWALDILESDQHGAKQQIAPEDLTPLFTHPDRGIRERALGLLPELRPAQEPPARTSGRPTRSR